MRKVRLEEDLDLAEGTTVRETWGQDLRPSTLTSEARLCVARPRTVPGAVLRPVSNRAPGQSLKHGKTWPPGRGGREGRSHGPSVLDPPLQGGDFTCPGLSGHL